MNNCYVIYDVETDINVDVVDYLTCAIGMCTRWEKENPGKTFGYKKAAGSQRASAHLIQQNSSKLYNFPE